MAATAAEQELTALRQKLALIAEWIPISFYSPDKHTSINTYKCPGCGDGRMVISKHYDTMTWESDKYKNVSLEEVTGFHREGCWLKAEIDKLTGELPIFRCLNCGWDETQRRGVLDMHHEPDGHLLACEVCGWKPESAAFFEERHQRWLNDCRQRHG